MRAGKNLLAIVLPLLVMLGGGWSCARVSAAQSDEEKEPVLSRKPLSDERVAVYHDFVTAWMGNNVAHVNLAIQTMPLDTPRDKEWSGDPEGCRKGLDLEPLPADEIHTFRAVDAWKIGGDKVRLVVAEVQTEEIKSNDPWNSIKKGDSVDSSVRNGFTHGLFKLSEIQFDKKHEHAILKFSFVCGELCGHGGTVVLVKKDGVWKETGACGRWIS